MDKKFLILIIAMFLIMPMVSADISINPFADKKIVEKEITPDMSDFIKADFNADYGVIRLSKTFLWFESDKIVEYSLISNTKNCSYDCEARGKAIFYSDGILFEDVQFKTLRGKDTSIISSEYQILDGFKEITLNVPATYKTVCKNTSTANGMVELCADEVASYSKEIEKVENWIAYKGDVLKAGEYEWRIIGQKVASKSVDFIPIRYDKEFSEWAVWGAGSFTINNKTVDSGWSSAGQTDSLGFRFSAKVSTKLVNVTKSATSGAVRCKLLNDGGGVLATSNFTGQYASFDYSLVAGTYYRIEVDNGGTGSYTSRYKAYAYPVVSIDINYTQGSKDGVNNGDWTRDIINVITFAGGSTLAINTPADYYNSSTVLISSFNCSAIIVGSTFKNWTLWTNKTGSWAEANSTTANGGLLSYSFSPDGYYKWGCEACDNDGDCGWSSSNRTLMVDTATPIVTITSPQNNSIVLNPSTNVSLNYSVVHPVGSLSACWYNTTSVAGITLLAGCSNTSFPYPSGSYQALGGTVVNPITADSGWSSAFQTETFGFKFTPKVTAMLVNATKSATSGVDNCLLKDNAGTVLANVSFVGNVCTINYQVNAGTYYRLEAGKGGASFTSQYKAYAFPINDPVLNITTGSSQGGDNTDWTREIVSVLTANMTFVPSALNLTVYVCANDSFNNIGCSSSYITRDLVAPTFALNSLNNVTSSTFPINTTLNVTITDSNLNACWFNTSETSAITIYPCNTATNVSILSGGAKTIYVYANDTWNNIAYTSYSMVSFGFNVTQSGSATAGEGSSQTFTLLINASYLIGDADADFVYAGAGVGYTTKTILDANSIYFTKVLVIPNGSGNSTGKSVAWYWSYNTTDLSTSTTTPQNQTVYSVSISDCNVLSGKVILNMSLKDEEFNTLLNVTSPNTAIIELDLDITSLSNATLVWQFSKTWTNNQTVAVCVPYGLLNLTSYKIDFTVGFEGTSHVKEFYYMDNGTLDNTANFNSYTDNSIDLMDLVSADSTTFLFSFTDESGLEIDNALIHTFRKYIGEGLFREVERSKQDNNGQTHVHLVEEDVIYYFMISQYGNIIYNSDTYNAKCLSTPCEISLSASPTETNWSIIDNEGGSYSITSDKTTRVVTTTFSIDSIDLVNVSLYKIVDGEAVFLNKTSITATAGSMALTVPLAYGNNTFFVAVYRNNTFIKSEWIDMTENGKNYFGTMGAILGGLIILTMMLMAVSEGAGFIIFTILGLLIIGIMQLVALSWMAIISIICAGAVILWKLVNRRGSQQ